MQRDGRGKGKREEGRDPQWQNFFVKSILHRYWSRYLPLLSSLNASG